jgi:hypothetical protein
MHQREETSHRREMPEPDSGLSAVKSRTCFRRLPTSKAIDARLSSDCNIRNTGENGYFPMLTVPEKDSLKDLFKPASDTKSLILPTLALD